MKYDKPPLSIEQQVDLLISRGMVIQDRARAARYLAHLNYYRLRAYWLTFEDAVGTNNHHFRPGIDFQDVLSLYIFDRKLRLLVLEAIERVEVSVRARFAYVLGTRYGSHSYLDKSYFADSSVHGLCLENLREEFDRSRETFIQHYKDKYDDPEMPPIWAACEIMSFGQLSKWFQNLRQRRDRQEIASAFRLNESVLGSFLHHLTHVRNLAAHHCRVWNRRLTFTMKIPVGPQEVAACFHSSADRNIYNTLVMLGYLLKIMSPGTTWPRRIVQLIEEYPLVNPTNMGFPTAWREMAIWRDHS
ncbi:MAG TPA: Abi family protein [Acidobacteriota bacterium]|nr:Abi family protein [Acidobacteriota bacterium]HQM64457.1 Abi family protein [Acidobacteriota bacterium]